MHSCLEQGETDNWQKQVRKKERGCYNWIYNDTASATFLCTIYIYPVVAACIICNTEQRRGFGRVCVSGGKKLVLKEVNVSSETKHFTYFLVYCIFFRPVFFL
jgi:hypothetical protein